MRLIHSMPAIRRRYLPAALVPVAAAAALVASSGHDAQAKGGTAKPPPGAVSPFVTPTLADPTFTVDPVSIHGFDVTGFIQDATVSDSNAQCPGVTDPDRYGGTVTLNNVTITVPCNTIIQMPANTFRWADFIHAGPSLSLGSSAFPSYEMQAVGNIVGTKHVAGLLFASQQSVNSGQGIISAIDYSTGNLHVDTGDPTHPAIVQVNDPNGRFGREQSPDERFSVDDANPTIHAGTGYPMCVPRTTSDPTVAGNPDDPKCPQRNRPKAAGGCRNFSVAGVVPPASGELSRPRAGQVYCSQYVMPFVGPTATTSGPDPREQAPFEVGDHITFSGTLAHGTGHDYISAHTVEANVGIYTQPGTQPSYLAIGEFGVGTADPSANAANGAAQETQDRMFVVTETTDVKTPVDIYLQDVDPQTGDVTNRWVTPYEMTGENQTGSPSGGITTQNTGPQPQRARLRATKAPTGLLSQPTRNIRVAVRSLCTPPSDSSKQAATDACFRNAQTVANGLKAGQYSAPVFEYIFPENVMAGDPIVPNDLWHLPALRKGEGAATPSGVGPLEPAPW